MNHYPKNKVFKYYTGCHRHFKGWPGAGGTPIYVHTLHMHKGQDGWLLGSFFFASLLTETKSRTTKTQTGMSPVSCIHLELPHPQ